MARITANNCCAGIVRNSPPETELADEVSALGDAASNGPTLRVVQERLARSAHPQDVALQSTIESIRGMIDASGIALVCYDPGAHELVVSHASTDQNAVGIGDVRLPADGGSIAATVFCTGQPHLSNDLSSDSLAADDLVQRYGMHNCIVAPMDIEKRRLGVISVWDKRGAGFDDNDLRLVRVLGASLAVITDHASRLECDWQITLQGLNLSVDRERRRLQRVLEIHNQMMDIALQDGGAPAICECLGQELGGDVMLVDGDCHHIASYLHTETARSRKKPLGSAFGNEVSGMPIDDPALAHLVAMQSSASGMSQLPPSKERGLEWSRLVQPIIVANHALGYLYIPEREGYLDGTALELIEQAAKAMAFQLISDSVRAARYRLRDDLVAALLSPRDSSDQDLLRQAIYLGIDPDLPRAAVAVAIDTDSAPADFPMRVLKVTERVCGPNCQTLVSARNDEIVIFASVREYGFADRRAQLHNLADALRGEVRRLFPQISVSVGIGSWCTKFPEYYRSYQEARRALGVIAGARQKDRTVAFDQLSPLDMLFDQYSHDMLVHLVESSLGPVLAYDRLHATALTETLQTYLLNDCHLDRTAAALHVHLTTLRYRLGRIAEIASIDLRHAESKFSIQLAFKILHRLNPSSDMCRDLPSDSPHAHLSAVGASGH